MLGLVRRAIGVVRDAAISDSAYYVIASMNIIMLGLVRTSIKLQKLLNKYTTKNSYLAN